MGPEGIVYRQVLICVLPGHLFRVLCVHCGGLKLPCAREICLHPLQPLHDTHTLSVPTPSVTNAFYKTYSCSKLGYVSSVACKCLGIVYVRGQVGDGEMPTICSCFQKKLTLTHLGDILYVINSHLITVLRPSCKCEGYL